MTATDKDRAAALLLLDFPAPRASDFGRQLLQRGIYTDTRRTYSRQSLALIGGRCLHRLVRLGLASHTPSGVLAAHGCTANKHCDGAATLGKCPYHLDVNGHAKQCSCCAVCRDQCAADI